MTSITGKPITSNGLGLMRLTLPNNVTPDELAFKVLRTALECGANVWNGADFYGTPDNNSIHLMNRYFTRYPEDAEKVIFTIKSGVADMATFKIDCSPEFMRARVDNANKILDGKKSIDAFGPARVDPNTPIETTIGGLAQLIKEGKINGIQLSEVGADTIRRAAKVHKIDMVEEEVSLWTTDIFTKGIAETCAELNIPILGHTPLGAGMLTGQIQSLDDMPATSHYRLLFPRFQPENFQQNLALVNEVTKLAKKKGCSNSELALAWLRSSGDGKEGRALILPIAGARSEERVRENCKNVGLSPEELKEISAVLEKFPVAGDRWPAAAMKFSEY